MAFVLKNSGRADPSEIADLEKRIGMLLPDDYKSFLAQNNGGKRVSGGVFREASTGRIISTVNIMLGIRNESSYSIERQLSLMQGRMPTSLLPIAYDSGGNYLLLDCSDERRGRVYFLGLEFADPDDPPTIDSLTLVSHSFGELIAQLESDD